MSVPNNGIHRPENPLSGCQVNVSHQSTRTLTVSQPQSSMPSSAAQKIRILGLSNLLLTASFLTLANCLPPVWSQTNRPPASLEDLPPVRPVDPKPIPDLPSTPKPTSPILPKSISPSSPTESPLLDAPEESFFVESIEVLGATVLQEEIEDEVKALENEWLNVERLLDLRTRITQLYIDNGYITSGAFLPSNQKLKSGFIKIQVVEGQIEDIQITGLKRLRKKYVRRRISPATKAPLNKAVLEKNLQLLQLNPLLKRVNAELTAGSAPGLNTLLIDIEPAREFHLGASIDNYRSPSIGSIQGNLNIAHDNLFGLGDRITGATSITDGLNLYEIGYTLPINARDGTIGVRYSNAASEIVASEFRDLDISNDFESLSFELRQPVVKTPNTEIALGFSFDLQENQSFLADQPFPFSQGPDAEGIAKTRVLRFSQEWTQRQPSNVVSLRSQFNLGVDIFDATVNATGPSANFFSWVGQAQYVQRLPLRALLISRLSTQLTPDALLNQERFGIGGIRSVRGYASNQLLTDNGILGSVECQFPLTSNPNILQLSPFIEAGKGWNNFGEDPDPSALLSIGVGIRWQPIPDLSLRFDYGLPLVGIEDQGNSLQEQGFYFSLQYQPL